MPVRRTLPKITYGTGFSKTIEFQYPLDEANTYTLPRGTGLRKRLLADIEAWWDDGKYDHFLQGVLRYIPQNTAFPTTHNYGPSGPGFGWDDGVRDWLEWCWRGNSFRWFKDSTSGTYQEAWLHEPTEGQAVRNESDPTKSLPITIRSFAEFTGY